MNKKILITGITGQVGSQLADYVLDNTTYDVIGMMRWQEPLDNLYHLTNRINSKNRIELCYADLLDYASLSRVISAHTPDFISHLAAQSFPKTSFNSPLETLQTNIIGTASLLEVVRQQRDTSAYDPVIHVCSSSEVYGRQKAKTRLTEDTPFHGSSPYSISKIGTDYLGRFYGEAYGMRTFVTRMGTHSGARRSDVFFESTVAKQIAMIEASLQEPVLRVGNLSSTRTFQDTRDAVRAYHLLLEAASAGKIPAGDFFNIAGEEAFELAEVVDILIGLSTRKDIVVEIDSNRLRPIDADYQMFDNTKIKQVISWSPRISAREMFEELLNHWRLEIARDKFPLNR